jgi:hypothetical protein
MPMRTRVELPSNLVRTLRVVRAQGPAIEREFLGAFEKICRKATARSSGFQPGTLAYWIWMLYDTAQEGVGQLLDPLCWGRTKAERFTRSEVEQIARQAHHLKKQIEKLKTTGLVIGLNWAGKIPEGDLLGFPIVADPKLSTFDAVISLPRQLGLCTPARPHVEYELIRFCEYVKQSTGRPNCALVSSLLYPLKIPHCESADAVKMFLSRARR